MSRSFWGVFWIDGRSRQLLKQTLLQNVARVRGVDANEKAALHWLSNLEERWLLIIDNADDPGIGLDDYLPKGNRGHVLITTRNPTNQSYGNVRTPMGKWLPSILNDHNCLRYYAVPPFRFVRLRYLLTHLPTSFR